MLTTTPITSLDDGRFLDLLEEVAAWENPDTMDDPARRIAWRMVYGRDYSARR
jgi:hypothetical protein